MAIKESDNLHKLLDEAKIMCKIGGLLNPDGSDSHDNVLKMFGVVFDGNLVEVQRIPLHNFPNGQVTSIKMVQNKRNFMISFPNFSWPFTFHMSEGGFWSKLLQQEGSHHMNVRKKMGQKMIYFPVCHFV